MTIQLAPEDSIPALTRSTDNTLPSDHERSQRHYLSLLIGEDGPALSFECRHLPVDADWARCWAEEAEDYGLDFIGWCTSASAELRSGLIDIWPLGFGDDAEMHWNYVTFVRPTHRPRTQSQLSDAKIDMSSIDSVGIVHYDLYTLPPVALVHGNEISRMLCIGSKDIELRQGVNVDFYNESYFEHQLLEAVAALRFLGEN
jgi:hypothetical protein